MSQMIPILLALPLLGAILCAVVPGRQQARAIALITSLLCFALTLPLLFKYDWSRGGVQFEQTYGSLDFIGFKIAFGADSISLWLVALTTFLQPLAIAASFQSIRERAREYYAWMLALLTAMLGVFVARDALLFYIFFELTLIPMFFIIGIWGGAQRRDAAGKFFLFTFAGSVFTLAALIYLYTRFGTFDITDLTRAAVTALTPEQRFWVALGLLAGFAVKVPLFPVHTWLPLAHTEAPTAGSVILAGVLLKLGTYGILRLVVPIGFLTGPQPLDTAIYSFNLLYGLETTHLTISLLGLIRFIGCLCIIGIIYGALVAWVQQDIKKLVAYSSVSHLGFCVLGLAAMNPEGMQGSILYMINHGLSTGALFLVIGMIYDRYHTRDINQLSGLARQMPIMAFFFILFTMSSIGLPGLNGFASEFLTILGAFTSRHLGIAYGSFAALGIILGAVYMLHMAARVIWGPLKFPHDDHHAAGSEVMVQGSANPSEPAALNPEPSPLPRDLSGREIGILLPIALAVIVIGVIPAKLLNTWKQPVNQLIAGEPKTITNNAVAQVPMP